MTGTGIATAIPALSQVHRDYLVNHAISDQLIGMLAGRGDLRSDGTDIVFTWRDATRSTEQRRSWRGDGSDLPGQYLWTADQPLHLNVLRESSPKDGPILLCEGTKQHLAVASWAPPEYAVVGMPGCYGWMNSDGRDLSMFAGRQVLILLDADAAGNLDVYEAGERLAAELEMEDAASAEFVPSPAWGKDGIDDYLAKIAADRRADRIAKLAAHRQARPADRKPAHRKVADQVPETGGRPMVIVNTDRRQVIHEILAAMQSLWNGTQLFTYGGVLTRLREAKTEPLDRDSFTRWMSEAVATFRYKAPGLASPGSFEAAWPEPQTIGALLASGDEFAPLTRVSRTPFARADGTICAKQGYDPETATMLVTGNSGMDRLDIPDSPGQADAARAAAYLLGDWLGDFSWRDEASRAAALALVLTPFIRGLVPLVPLAVISGLQPGVGKNLLADCVMLAVAGEIGPPLPWLPDDDDENRKQILSAFRAGTSLIIFDEAHRIGGTALTRALTSITYADRILGVSKMASYPNQVTWISLGNQVQVQADMARRAYWIEIYPTVPDPENRPESDFDHPDLRGWTKDNRPELVTAVLVMIRAWYAAGCPAYSRGALMGSFEAWDKMISGILGYAGVPGFLANQAERRAERDTSGGYWSEHLSWLHEQFGGREFTVLEVKAQAIASAGAWDGPPGLDEPDDRGFARNLGAAYGRVADRFFGSYRLVKTGIGHRKVQKWWVQDRDAVADGNQAVPPVIPPVIPPAGSPPPIQPTVIPPNPSIPPVPQLIEGIAPDLVGRDGEGSYPAASADVPVQQGSAEPGGMEGLGGTPTPDVYAYAPAHTHAHRAYTREGAGDPTATLQSLPRPPGLSLAFDLETGPADEVFTYQPHDETGFVRLPGVIGPSGVPVIAENVPQLIGALDAADEIVGHNILGFDGPALAWHHRRDDPGWWERFCARARDTEIIARQAYPPRSRETGPADKLGLDNVAELLGLPGKTDDLKRLKTRHRGYDRIPLDDEEYRSYLHGDLRASAAVGQLLNHDDYTRREHRLAALAGRMSLNGFAVDHDLLARRLEEGAQRKAQALSCLHDGWGLPLTKTITRGRGAGKHEIEQDVISPLSTDAGRAWLEKMWDRYQVPDPPRTEKAGKLALGIDELAAVARDPACPPDLRAMLALMGIVTGTRTVYQNVESHLAADGRVHPSITMRQASGRWSTTNPGLTVFGKHEGRHVERDVLIADEGHVLFSCDLAQVDMRGIGALCQDLAYLALFEPGRDAHAEIAAMLGIARQDAKARGHGWNYGLGAARMIREGADPDVVYAFVNGMEARFPRLIAWREEIRAHAGAGGILDNGFGRRMRADPARAYTVAPALMGQGSAGDIMKEVLLRLDTIAPELRPYYRVMVHDEQVFSCPERDAAEIIHDVKQAFTWEWAPPGASRAVPILCEINGPGKSWGEISAK